MQYFLQHEVFTAYVTNAENRLIGTISIHDIKDPEVSALGPLLIAGDIAEINISTVTPTNTLAECMDRFVLSEHAELPVVDAEHNLIGVVSRRDVLRVYSTELLRHEYLGVMSTDREGSGARRAVRLTPGMNLARVRTPKWLVGRSLQDANLRVAHNLTVVAVQCGGKGDDQLPEPDRPLGQRDVQVVVGRAADIEEFQGRTERLATARAAPR